MDHNRDRQTTFRENQARTHVLSKEVQHLQEEKSKQVSSTEPPPSCMDRAPLGPHAMAVFPSRGHQRSPGAANT